ncbi:MULTISPECIES: alanine racemase [Mycobacteriaceae]|uniref:Alanine racemase n=1 Tax=Mycolicibacterium neoaurum VKM Ac-1815D TaxID=700508 RepID=V5XAI2_MYCNE|nr:MULTISPECIES: alanine racemase [Mycobacteriaceae]AHC24419.1 alanine racemase [Mycolicibacterium neoaurum VKM Ac-1815D]AMO05019.1 alanine racemase [Mycolicibacterium neoaurum]KJQ52113.1 alanine racemase [Mycolicibacterium neoaurum]KUM07741.1 alanine racemase [Mycolicibacterium neoaurum]
MITTENVPRAIVDLDAIAHNVTELREHAGSAAVMAVVKADGYGHGAVRVAQAALAAGAAELGVATVAEAAALQSGGVTAPLLAWLHAPDTDFAPAVRTGVQLAVSSAAELSGVLDAVRRTGDTATVTVKADTGLSRNGVSPAEFDEVLAALATAQADGSVRVRGLMSHLAHGDTPDHPFNGIQGDRLREFAARARRHGIHFELLHLANSPAALTRPDLAFDMVRPGIAVYGQTPIPERGAMGLRPAMTVACPVAKIRALRAGDGVSYGHTWVADRDTTVALIPAGYADGVFRSLSNRLEVAINGRRYPAVGRVCMDQFVVDLGPDGAGVNVGDAAILFGPGDRGEPTAQDWADLLGTINYEVVTSPRGRIVRSYTGGPEGTP